MVTLPLVGRGPAPAHPASPPVPQPAVIAAVPKPDPLTLLAHRRAEVYHDQQDGIRFAAFSGGRAQERLVTLTFDDGPDPAVTPRILDILKREKVPATFFIVGRKAAKYPQLVRREAAEGHDLGNHTYHHYELTWLDPTGLKFEIQHTNDTLRQILGVPTRWFRAPGCHYTQASLKVIRDLGMVRVDTTDNSGDWAGYGVRSILNRVMTHLSPGDVILCHDRMPETVQALPILIRSVRRRGYRFVPLAELARRAQQTPGFRPDLWPDNEGITLDRTPARRNAALVTSTAPSPHGAPTPRSLRAIAAPRSHGKTAPKDPDLRPERPQRKQSA